jgi:chitodextrinase
VGAVATIALALILPAATSFAQVTHESITVNWTTPGDDGTIGTAAQFDLRYSTTQITSSNFDSATRWTNVPNPGAPGSRQSATITGLQANTRYWFAIKTGDDVPNWAPISNVVSGTTLAAPDLQRPAPLAVNITSMTDTTALLSWTAVGDDSLTGTAASYDLRYSTSTITNSNWASATQVTGEPAPASPGSTQQFTVTGLSRQVRYYFAAKVSDDAGNVSALSNVPSAVTPDTMPPAAVQDLVIGWVHLGWRTSHALRPRGTEAL